MDSRLLNVFHDDPFDGNFAKYDNDADFWSSGSETMGLQLTETLHGILPIAPTDELLNDDFHLEHKDDTSILQNKNVLIYDDLTEQHIAAGGSIEIVTVDPITDDYDTDSDNDDYDEDDNEGNNLNAFDNRSQCSISTFRTRTDSSSIGDYESHSSDYDDEDDDDNDQTQANSNSAILLVPDDLILQSRFKLPMDTVAGSSCKNRTFSTNTIGSDVDGLGLQIDASTFDLADFITKDDFALNATALPPIPTAKPTTTAPKLADAKPQQQLSLVTPVVQVISSRHTDSDSDSDVIVDVETVEIDADEEKSFWATTVAPTDITHEDVVPFVDNIKGDPSWSPNQTKKVEKPLKEQPSTLIPTIAYAQQQSTTQQQHQQTQQLQQQQQQQHNFGRNFSLIPSKKQSDFLKGKFGSGRGKNQTTQRIAKTTTTTTTKKQLLSESVITTTESVEKPPMAILKPAPAIRKLGMGQGGKNLALIKHDRLSISEQSSEENATPIKTVQPPIQNTPLAVILSEQQPLQQQVQHATQGVKRKLNLEEYKKRRGEGGSNSTPNNKIQTYKIPKLDKEANAKLNASTAATAHSIPINTMPIKHSAAVTSIVKSLKEQQKKPAMDPITEAKNKVLRMQELKRAQQLKIIDSAVSAKVPRVTKLLPLREIVKDTYGVDDEEQKKFSTALRTNADYEEIIIVSTSCNTDISLPPSGTLEAADLEHVNQASRSLLKSSALLYNISNSFQRVQANESINISTSSLIASIQDVVVKQTMPTNNLTTVENEGLSNNRTNAAAAASVITANGVKKIASATGEQHGENKIIMHLRKDRIRQHTCCMSTQTEFLPEFPPLPLPKCSTVSHKSRDRTRRKARRNYRKRNVSNSSSLSSASSFDDDRNGALDSFASRSPAVHSYRSRSRSAGVAAADSCSSSTTERMRQDTTTGYSSRSSRRHRSSISSSYSESGRVARRSRRQRKSSYKNRMKHHARSSSTSSMSDYSDRSRTRSRSPHERRTDSRASRRDGYNYVDRNVSQPAVEERRIVYVGRIEQETTKEMLRRKFLSYGNIKQITIHYKDTGMKYGFVTYERSADAFTVIDTSARDPHINMYDISFGGRRAFCRASYADLDNAGINTYQSYVFPQAAAPPKEDDSFEALLLKVKAKMNASKTASNTNASTNVNKI